MSSPQVTTGDRIIDPMIALAGCSTRQRIVVAGSKSMELMLELHRRGYLLAAAAGNCGRPTGQYDVALVDWRRRTLHALETTMDWLVNFLGPCAVLVVWVDAQKPAANESLRSLSCTAPCMNAVARFWRDDRRPIRSKRRRSAPSGDRNSCTTRVSSDQGGFPSAPRKRVSRWPSRRYDAPSFASGWHLRARNDNPASSHWLLQKPRSNDTACHAAAERRTT